MCMGGCREHHYQQWGYIRSVPLAPRPTSMGVAEHWHGCSPADRLPQIPSMESRRSCSNRCCGLCQGLPGVTSTTSDWRESPCPLEAMNCQLPVAWHRHSSQPHTEFGSHLEQMERAIWGGAWRICWHCRTFFPTSRQRRTLCWDPDCRVLKVTPWSPVEEAMGRVGRAWWLMGYSTVAGRRFLLAKLSWPPPPLHLLHILAVSGIAWMFDYNLYTH